MDILAAADALEQSIFTVAEREFGLLTKGLNRSQVSQRVSQASRSLDELRFLRSPNYNDKFVALFYLAQYQMAHINMAYSAIRAIRELRKSDTLLLENSNALRIVDFGCGSLAVKLGATLALADALDKGENICDLRIDSIDECSNMIEVGEKLWNQFVTYIGDKLRNDSLYTACEIVGRDSLCCTDHTAVMPVNYAENWLIALHTIYRSNAPEVSNALRSLYETVKPVAGLLSCYHHQNPNRSNTPIAKRIFPFPRKDLRSVHIYPQMPETPRGANARIAQMCRAWNFFPENYTRIFWGWKHGETAFLMYAPELETLRTEGLLGTNLSDALTEEKKEGLLDDGQGTENAQGTSDEEINAGGTPTSTFAAYSVGERVFVTGIGQGQVIRIDKKWAQVVLANGMRCRVSVSELQNT